MRAVALLLLLAAPACTLDATLGHDRRPLDPGHLEVRWSQTIGGFERSAADRVVMNAGGDVIVGGHAKGELDFTAAPATLPPALIAPESADTPTTAFVTMRAAVDGAHLWGVATEIGLESAITEIGLDGSGNVYITGYVIRSVDAAGVPTAEDMFVAKYAPGGQVMWKRSLGDASLAEAYGLAVDSAGDVVVSGVFRGTVDFGGGPVTCVDPYPVRYYQENVGDAFLARLDPYGSWRWGHVFAANGLQVIGDIAFDHEGGVVAAGYSKDGAAAFGGAVITQSSGHRAIVARFSEDGDPLWSRALDPVAGDEIYAYSVAPDLVDGVDILSYEASGAGALVSVVTVDDQGETITATSISHPMPASMMTTPGGMVITTASNMHISDVGTGPLEGDAMLGVFDSTGAVLDATAFASAQAPFDGAYLDFNSGTTNGSQIAIAGDFNYGVDLGLGTLWAHGSGPIDSMTASLNGRDGLVALFDWVTD